MEYKIEIVIQQDEYNSISEDYEIIENVSSEAIDYSIESVERFKKMINIFDQIQIIFAELPDDTLGMFRSETSTSIPVILLSERSMINASDEQDLSFYLVVATTIFHELGHAICELDRNLDLQILNYDDEEEWVEDFSYQFYNTNTVQEDITQLIHVLR